VAGAGTRAVLEESNMGIAFYGDDVMHKMIVHRT
jgi:hypothetical protein